MILLVSLIVLLRGLFCFHDFWHGVSHPYIPIHSDFCTCIIQDCLLQNNNMLTDVFALQPGHLRLHLSLATHAGYIIIIAVLVEL